MGKDEEKNRQRKKRIAAYKQWRDGLKEKLKKNLEEEAMAKKDLQSIEEKEEDDEISAEEKERKNVIEKQHKISNKELLQKIIIFCKELKDLKSSDNVKIRARILRKLRHNPPPKEIVGAKTKE